jgi:hypothetical protein
VTLLRDGIKLGYAFAGKNSTDLENKTLKMVSPRFLSVTPEQDPEHNETVKKKFFEQTNLTLPNIS